MEQLTRHLRVLAGTAVLVLLSHTAAWAQGRWTNAAPLREASEEFTSASANGKIYLFGGTPSSETDALPGLVQEYDPVSDKWAKKNPMPVATHHAAAADYRGKIYLFGGGLQPSPGGPNQFPTSNAWEYDPSTDMWRALAPMPTARLAAVAVETNGKIYVIGGASVHTGAKLASLESATPQRALDVNEVYDPATNRWNTRSAMPTARNHAAAGVLDGKIYVIGGRLASASVYAGSNTDVVEEFDPAINRWGAAGLRMPTSRSSMGWAVYGTRIYIAGGEVYDAHMFATVRAVEAYEPISNQWSTLPNLPTARHGVSVAVVGDRLYVIGGHVQAGSVGGDGAHSGANEVFEFSEK